jgi:hypothetical protein
MSTKPYLRAAETPLRVARNTLLGLALLEFGTDRCARPTQAADILAELNTL